MSFYGPRHSRIVRTILTTGRLLASMLQGRERRQRALITSQQSEGLEARILLTHLGAEGVDHHPHVVFAPDTPQSIVDAYEAEHHHDEEVGVAEFNADGRWTNTATDGGGIPLGQAITLTWSIAPDGTNIPGFNGEATAPSDLVETFRGYYNDVHLPSDTDYVGEAWFTQIEAAMNEWSDVSGITYIY